MAGDSHKSGMNVKDVAEEIQKLSTAEEVINFVAGDGRSTVLRKADERLEALEHDGLLDDSGKVVKEEFKELWAANAPTPPEKAQPPKDGQTGEITKTEPARGGGIDVQKSTGPKGVTMQQVADDLRKQGHRI